MASVSNQCAPGADIAPGVSVDMRCPCCHQSYDVVRSRMQRHQGFVRQAMFVYFKCNVCGIRFKAPTAWFFAAVGVALAAGVTPLVLMVVLGSMAG